MLTNPGASCLNPVSAPIARLYSIKGAGNGLRRQSAHIQKLALPAIEYTEPLSGRLYHVERRFPSESP